MGAFSAVSITKGVWMKFFAAVILGSVLSFGSFGAIAGGPGGENTDQVRIVEIVFHHFTDESGTTVTVSEYRWSDGTVTFSDPEISLDA
jgi:hypothetical protein